MKKFQSGISLLEILLGLVLICAFLGTVAIYFNSLNQRSILVTQAAQQIQQLASISYEWKSAQSQTDFSGLSLPVLQEAGLLNSADTDAQKSPWGQDFILSADTADPSYLKILINKIPEAACANLIHQLSNIAHRQSYGGDCAKGTYFIVL